MVNHLDRFASEVTTQHSWPTRFEGELVNIELVRVNGTLNDRLAKAIGRGNKYDAPEAGFSIQCKHNAAGGGFTAHHLLDAGRQSHKLVVKAMVNTVGNRTIVKQGSKHLSY